MAIAIVRHQVSSFNAWKAIVDELEPMRRKDGMTSWNIYTAQEDDCDVTAVLQFDSAAEAEAHLSNPELKAKLQSAGVVSKPQISFLKAH